MKLLQALSRGLEKFESLLMALTLLFMIGVAFLQVVLRNFWDTGIAWGDPVVRALVLWVGFLGASIATQKRSHIRFDVFAKFLPRFLHRWADVVVYLSSAGVSVLLAKASYEFVLSEKEFGDMLVPHLPSWIALSIIPVGFCIIAFRMFLAALEDISGVQVADAGEKVP